MAEITLTPKESEDFFYSALCNTLSMGIMNGYGLQLDYRDEDYKSAKQKLKDAGQDTCIEDIWMQILRDGNKLTLEDFEGDGDMTRSITLEDVHNKVKNMPIEHLSNYINENDDAETGDVLLQIVFFDEVVYG